MKSYLTFSIVLLHLSILLFYVCSSLFTLSLLALNAWIWVKKVKLSFPRIVVLNFIPFIFLIPLFFQMLKSDHAFRDAEVSGKIRNIIFSKGTVLFVGKDSTRVDLEFVAEGLAVDDSLYKPSGSMDDFYFFKLDSLNSYREIEFYSDNDRYFWRFKK